MIAIRRAAEPKELADERHWRLPKQQILRQRGSSAPEISGYDPQSVKNALYHSQLGLCAFCGERIRLSGMQVEHFRPKGAVDGRLLPRSVAKPRPGYWWLAWTWENLLFSCSTCNTIFKKSYFPIHGSPLHLLDFDLRNEDALLIDPSRTDPMQAITWYPLRWLTFQHRPIPEIIRHLRWKPQAKTLQGKKTIEFLNFRGDLTRHVSDHIRGTVWKSIEASYHYMKGGEEAKARRAWRAIQSDLFGFNKPFQAATYDAISLLFPQAITHLGLQRPGAVLAPWRTPVPLPPAPLGLPDTLWLRILACRSNDSASEKQAILNDLRVHRSILTKTELQTHFPILATATLLAQLP